jgi:hypothetical protein
MSQDTFAELRSQLQLPPSAQSWRAICALLDQHPDDDALLVDHLIPYAVSSMRRWPDELAMIPPHWLNDLLEGRGNPRQLTVHALALYHTAHDHLVHRGLAAMANSPHLQHLRSLTLQSIPLAPQSAAFIANTPHLPALHALHIRAHKLSSDALQHLTGAPLLARLQAFSLEYASLDDDLVRRLIAHLDGAPLRALCLDSSRCPAIIAPTIATSALPKTLQSLRLSGAELLVDGARALAYTDFAQLTELRISGARIGDAGLHTLLDAPWFHRVQRLDLSYNKLTSRGAHALASSTHLAQLTELSLYGNTIGDDGAIALAQSPHLGQLDTLRLEPGDITSRGAQALATSQTLKPHLRDHWRASPL